MNKLVLMALGFALLGAVFSCSPKNVPPEQSASPLSTGGVSPGSAVTAKPTAVGWQAEWDRVIADAKKEGRVVVVNAGGMIAARPALTKAFKDKFGIEAEFISGRGEEVGAKLLSERRAGLYLADVYTGGATTIANTLMPSGILEPMDQVFILPETTDPKLWWSGKPLWIDQGRRARSFLAYTSPPLTINTELTSASELRYYRDLLNPRLKGKIIMDDPTITGSALKWFGVVGTMILNMDFMRELAKQEPAINRDQRLQVEWLARGKYAAGISLQRGVTAEFTKSGAPLGIVTPAEGGYLTSGGGNIGFITRAPHPNAAKVFINWLLTREGQIISSQSTLLPSARLDVPTDNLDEQQFLKTGVNYINSDSEEFLLKQPEQAKIAREIFGALMK